MSWPDLPATFAELHALPQPPVTLAAPTLIRAAKRARRRRRIALTSAAAALGFVVAVVGLSAPSSPSPSPIEPQPAGPVLSVTTSPSQSASSDGPARTPSADPSSPGS